MIKKHEDFEKSLAAQEEKIKALDEFATKLIEGQHYAAEDVAEKRALLLQRRSELQDKSAQRRIRLEDAYNYQQFDRDCDETKGWLNEKLKIANDENYLDPTNINGKVQKHQNFDIELQANKNRFDEVLNTGRELVEACHVNSDQINLKMQELSQLWKDLQQSAERKSIKLQEAAQQQQFNRGIEDLELWVSEIEAQLVSEASAQRWFS
jgi:spectrin alpha